MFLFELHVKTKPAILLNVSYSTWPEQTCWCGLRLPPLDLVISSRCWLSPTFIYVLEMVLGLMSTSIWYLFSIMQCLSSFPVATLKTRPTLLVFYRLLPFVWNSCASVTHKLHFMLFYCPELFPLCHWRSNKTYIDSTYVMLGYMYGKNIQITLHVDHSSIFRSNILMFLRQIESKSLINNRLSVSLIFIDIKSHP